MLRVQKSEYSHHGLRDPTKPRLLFGQKKAMLIARYGLAKPWAELRGICRRLAYASLQPLVVLDIEHITEIGRHEQLLMWIKLHVTQSWLCVCLYLCKCTWDYVGINLHQHAYIYM